MRQFKLFTFCLSALLICGFANCDAKKMKPWTKSAAETGKYRNYFKELGYSQKEIDKKIADAFHEVFESERRAYFEVGDSMAYVADVKNRDVRTEGQSYGMMVAVQMESPSTAVIAIES